VVKIIEDCFLTVESLEITFHINLLASGSIPLEGSSKKMIGGFPIRAIATDSLRLFPPEYVPAGIFSNAVRFKSLSYFCTKAGLFSTGIPLMAA